MKHSDLPPFGEAPEQRTDKSGRSANDLRIGYYVHDVSRLRRTLFDQKMKPLGVTRSQWWVLAQLGRSEKTMGEQGMLQTELANILDVGKVTIGGLIDRLEAGGFVKRTPCPNDRRAKRVVVTEAGRKILQQMTSVSQELNAMILQGIPKESIAVAESALNQMKQNIMRELHPDDFAEGEDHSDVA